MNAGQPQQDKPVNRSRIYLIVAWVLLVGMALMWSLDSSIVYILLGLAIFFLFLYFRNKPWASPQTTFKSRTAEPRSETDHAFENLKNIFANRQSRTRSGTSVQDPKKFMLGILIFIGSVFFVIIFSVIFSESESGSGEAMYYYQTGEQFRGSGQYDSADRYYLQALRIQPDYPEALVGYGYSLINENRYDTAASTFDAALRLDGDQEEAYYGKALSLYYAKNYPQSLKELFRLMDLNASHFGGMLLAGDNYQMQNRYDSALYWYQEGYDMGTPTAGLCNAMGYIYDTQGNTEKAIQLYREALGYDSTRVDVYNRLGELFPGQDGAWYRSKAQQLKSEGY
jgi:Tfp pilus assembly protein PilF